MTWQPNRRTFFQVSAAAAATLATSRFSSARDLNSSLRVASIGPGRKGKDDLLEVAASPRVEIVALCNVDQSADHFGWAVEKYPRANHYIDFRTLFDRPHMFDAVIVSTPDHMHAPIAVAAMQMGKHVFCQKPLTHTVAEARRMREVAAYEGVVTQMGNQIQSHPAYRTAVKLVRDGAIGKVREVHAWQSGDMEWLPKEYQVAGWESVPKTLNWNLWLGVAACRPYKSAYYHPKNWRGWQAFGTGQLGDFGCHILDPVFMALELAAPSTVESETEPLGRDIWGSRCKVSYQFPGTSRTVGERLPVTWYDGRGHKPKRKALGLPKSYKLPHAGSVMIGEEGTMVVPHWSEPQLFPKEKFAEFKLPAMDEVNHYTSWVDACLGNGKPTSNFDYAGPLTEAVLLGTIANRFPREQLVWDAAKGEFEHHADATARLTKEYRRGWPNPLA